MDHFTFDEFDKRGSKIEHAFFLCTLDHFKKIAFAGIQDVLLNDWRIEQNFERWNTSDRLSETPSNIEARSRPYSSARNSAQYARRSEVHP